MAEAKLKKSSAPAEKIAEKSALAKLRRQCDGKSMVNCETKKKLTIRDAIRAISEKGGIGKALDIILDIFWGDKNAIKGLDFSIKKEKINAVSDNQAAIFLSALSLEKINKNRSNWKRSLYDTAARTAFAYKLHRAGYDTKGRIYEATNQPIKADDKKISELIGKGKMQEVKEKGIVGVLEYDKPLPNGSYLYISKEGYPLYVSNNPDDRRRIRLYHKAENDTVTDSKNDSMLEFLGKKLQPGDVILSVTDENKAGFVRGLAGRVIQSIQNSFPLAHSAIYLGNGRVAHIADGGGKTLSLAEFAGVGGYADSIVIMRHHPVMSINPELLVKAEQYTQSITSYSHKGLLAKTPGIGKFLTKKMAKDSNSAICLDLLKQVYGNEASVDDILQLYQSPNFQVMYAANVRNW